jgi:hypothetical protein
MGIFLLLKRISGIWSVLSRHLYGGHFSLDAGQTWGRGTMAAGRSVPGIEMTGCRGLGPFFPYIINNIIVVHVSWIVMTLESADNIHN